VSIFKTNLIKKVPRSQRWFPWRQISKKQLTHADHKCFFGGLSPRSFGQTLINLPTLGVFLWPKMLPQANWHLSLLKCRESVCVWTSFLFTGSCEKSTERGFRLPSPTGNSMDWHSISFLTSHKKHYYLVLKFLLD